jgi:uncharacterized phiE125 gp8 family phage protein
MPVLGRYEQTIAPATEPVTVADMEDHARISDLDPVEEGYIDGLISKARRYVERALNRQLITATWVVYLERFPVEIELWKLPVQSITSIQYVDTDGATQTLDPAQYQVDLSGPDQPARIKPAYGCVWPNSRGETYQAVIITFTAGYGDEAEDVPGTLLHAIQLLAAHLYRQREPVNAANLATPIPLTIESMLGIEDAGVYA